MQGRTYLEGATWVQSGNDGVNDNEFNHESVLKTQGIGGLQAFPEDLKDKSAAAMLVEGTKKSGGSVTSDENVV